LTVLKCDRVTDEATSQPQMNQSAKPPFTSANFKQMLLISSPIVTAET